MTWVYEIKPTIAMERGDSYIAECSYCGTLICIPSASNVGKQAARTIRSQLGNCPRCANVGRVNLSWLTESEPIGPFRGWQLSLFEEAT